MQNPPDDGRSIGHFRDYTEGMDVHYSSGVYNKAFYLLSVSSGWNIQKAFQVWHRVTQLLCIKYLNIFESMFESGAGYRCI